MRVSVVINDGVGVGTCPRGRGGGPGSKCKRVWGHDIGPLSELAARMGLAIMWKMDNGGIPGEVE